MLKISKILSSAFVSVFLLPSVSHAGDEMIAVVLTPTTASFVGGAGVSTLSRGEVVRVLKRHGATIDAERLDDPPNWDTLTSEEITKAKRPLSLRADAIISVQLLKEVHHGIITDGQHIRFVKVVAILESPITSSLMVHLKPRSAGEMPLMIYRHK